MKKISFVFAILFILVGAFSTDASARCRTWPECGNPNPPPRDPFIPLEGIRVGGVTFRDGVPFAVVDLERCIESSDLPIWVRLVASTRTGKEGLSVSEGRLTYPNGETHSLLPDIYYANIPLGETYDLLSVYLHSIGSHALPLLSEEGEYAIQMKVSASRYRDTFVIRRFTIDRCN